MVAASLALALLGYSCASNAQTMEFRLLTLDGHQVAWRAPVDGSRLVLTYAIATADVAFPAAKNCRKIAPVEGLLARSALEKPVFRRELGRAMALWQSIAQISFREVDDPVKADILIGAQVEPEGWAYADVFFDQTAQGPIKPITKGLVCLNPAQRWKVGFDGNLNSYDLRYTLAHEIGHTIGLDHPSRSGQVMSYRYEEKFNALQRGDVAGAVQLYGSSSSSRADISSIPPGRDSATPEPATSMGLQ